MSEFCKEDALRWLQIALERNCSLEKAIYYDVYFSNDDLKFTRAYMFFCREMNVEPTQHIEDCYERNYEKEKN